MMYVLQVKPGTDLHVAVQLRKKGHLVRCPQKTMEIRNGGLWSSRTEPIFPGYLFVEEVIDRKRYDSICQTDGVIGFVKSLGSKVGMLMPCEEAYIRWLWNGGRTITASRIYTTSRGDKMVMSGVLRNYWDNIIHLDLRHRRAKIKIPLCGHDYTIALPVIGI